MWQNIFFLFCHGCLLHFSPFGECKLFQSISYTPETQLWKAFSNLAMSQQSSYHTITFKIDKLAIKSRLLTSECLASACTVSGVIRASLSLGQSSQRFTGYSFCTLCAFHLFIGCSCSVKWLLHLPEVSHSKNVLRKRSEKDTCVHPALLA